MGGLLYKDFTAVKGKRLVITLLVLTGIFIILRFVFAEADAFPDLRMISDDGDVISFIDVLSWTLEGLLLCLSACFTLTFSTIILQCDEKNTTGHYLSALPVSKQTYVASKYVFCGILLYVFFSLYEIWHIVSIAFMKEGPVYDNVQLIAASSLPLLGSVMLILTIELPLFLLLGRQVAGVIKDGVMLCIGLGVLAYFLFGDLDVFSRFDIGIIKTWVDTHEFEVFLFSLLIPPVTLGLYYVSYRITAALYKE
ncbi:MAG: ABC-2 transporter permease [Lachnospiraceae bacterium]|nr:ABC-2 transporter permease [Lachnospiraceae bacterium]